MCFENKTFRSLKVGDFMLKRITACLLTTAIIAGSAAIVSGCNTTSETADSSSQTTDSAKEESVDFKTADKVEDGAILQAFCWDFNTIKQSMADIAAAGFTAVQTSPINECLEGEDGGMNLYGDGKWYYHYQPTDLKSVTISLEQGTNLKQCVKRLINTASRLLLT